MTLIPTGVPVTGTEPKPAQNRGNRRYLEQSAFQAFYNGLKREVTLSNTPPEFDRDEALVCMALAFCLAGASTSVIYRLLG
jgi:hypothetical protein